MQQVKKNCKKIPAVKGQDLAILPKAKIKELFSFGPYCKKSKEIIVELTCLFNYILKRNQ
jgi:hypothetical protein